MGKAVGQGMLDNARINRNVLVLRTIDLDVHWDQLTDRVFLHDTIGDELLIVSRETLNEIVQSMDTMSLSAL